VGPGHGIAQTTNASCADTAELPKGGEGERRRGAARATTATTGANDEGDDGGDEGDEGDDGERTSASLVVASGGLCGHRRENHRCLYSPSQENTDQTTHCGLCENTCGSPTIHW